MSGGFWSVLLPILLILFLLLAVVLLAGLRRTPDKGSAQRATSIPHLYAYAVLLLTIVFGLGSVSSIPRSVAGLVFPLGAPTAELSADDNFNNRISLTSYDAYRATAAIAAETTPWPGGRFANGAAEANAPAADTVAHLARPDPVANEAERARYARMRVGVESAVRVDEIQSLTSDLVALIVCVVVYCGHARWLKAIGPEPNGQG